MTEPDLESLIREHRRQGRRADLRMAARQPRGPLDTTMDDVVSAQFDGEPLMVTMRHDRPDGSSVIMQVPNEQKWLAGLIGRGWIGVADE